MKALFILLGIVGILAGGAAYYATYLSADPPPTYRTVTVTRGDLVSTINATGTIEPEEVIDVGAQVTGRIEKLGRDPHDLSKDVDWGTAVEEGTVLVTIDPALYQAQYDQAKAALAHAESDLLELQAKCDQTEQEWKRAQSLMPQKAIADTDYDLDKANWLVAKANVEVGKTTIEECKATLALAKTNLDYCTIKSPVKGVVISRRVNVGQTVVSAMSVSSLFLLGRDLRRLQVWASVNEADVGRIRPGMPVHFTVDAFPGETFEGKVLQTRLDAQTTQNVVTYTVVVTTDNPATPDYPNGKLLPYLTANLNFEVDRHPNVLKVSNVALRWKPQLAEIAPDARRAAKGANNSAAGAQPGGSAGATPAATADKNQKTDKPRTPHSRLWVKDGNYVRPVRVQIGPSDGSATEVSGGADLKEGLEVVIGESRGAESADDSAATKNPFLPQIRPGGTQQKPKQQ
jgi:HlyD family secretion protein